MRIASRSSTQVRNLSFSSLWWVADALWLALSAGAGQASAESVWGSLGKINHAHRCQSVLSRPLPTQQYFL